MIMKNPIIMTQSAVQGFGERRESRAVAKLRCFPRWAPFGAACRVPPGDLGVALVMHPPRFNLATTVTGHSAESGYPVCPGERPGTDLCPGCIIQGEALRRAGTLA
jgi:hypothetical protein